MLRTVHEISMHSERTVGVGRWVRGLSLSIMHISDLHLEPLPETFFPGVNESLERTRPLLIAQRPDFIVCTGDLTSHGCARRGNLVRAREWLDALGIAYLTLPGNHDQGPNREQGRKFPQTELYEEAPFAGTNFASVFEQGVLVSRDLGEVVIVGVAVRDGDPDGAVQQLDALLQTTRAPVIVCGHYPLVNVREHGVLADFGFAESIPATAPVLLDCLRRHRNVVVYLCGHVHASTCRPLSDRCVQLSAGALGPGPSVFRMLRVYGDSIDWTTQFGGGSLDFWMQRLPGFSVLPEYHLGYPQERVGHIAL